MIVNSQRGTTLTVSTDLVVEKCCSCHVVFAMPRELHKRRIDNPFSKFFCPNGHEQWYIGENEAAKLRRQLAVQQAAHDQTSAALRSVSEQVVHKEHQLRGTKAALTRVRNRIGKGVCPCCNRHFEALDRHMHDQHPEYVQATVGSESESND